MKTRFPDRSVAGWELALALQRYRGAAKLLVLALPRGGVPVAFEVASALHAPLDVFVVRKLGTPGQRELAMGAIASGGVRVFNEELLPRLRLDPKEIEEVVRQEEEELTRREQLYRGDVPGLDVRGKTVILIDDGIATGATMRAAIQALRMQQPAWLVVAVPVCAGDIVGTLRSEADDFVALRILEEFYAVGDWYEDFGQTSDEEVTALLRSARKSFAAQGVAEE